MDVPDAHFAMPGEEVKDGALFLGDFQNGGGEDSFSAKAVPLSFLRFIEFG